MISIDTLEVIKGKLPRRVLALVLEWAALSRNDLKVDWELAVLHEPLNQIEPLE